MELLLIASPKLSSQRSFHVTKIYGNDADKIVGFLILYNKAEAKEASYPYRVSFGLDIYTDPK